MRLRSLLFVPGDRPDRMVKALGFSSDALILDLEDSVAPAAKKQARKSICRFVREADRGSVKLFVRVNPLDGSEIDADLQSLIGARLDGIVLPKADGSVSVENLARRMAAQGLVAPILPIASETPAAIFRLGDYGKTTQLLAGLTWGREDLSVAIGSSSSQELDGRLTMPYEIARSLTLFGAVAAGVPPIDTVYPNFRDAEGLRAYADRAARDGFTGMMAIHPSQVPVINQAFSPSATDVAHARKVVEAFSASPAVGALQLDGQMLDAPHLKNALRVLRQAGDDLT